MTIFFSHPGRLVLPLFFLAFALASGWGQASKLDTTKVSDFVATGDSIQDVMTLLGQDLNLRIVVSPQVKGNVNANLTGEVTLRAILDTILPPLGATYMEESGIIRIMTETEAAALRPGEQMVTKTFRLKNRKVEDIKPILESYKTNEGKITLDVENNSVTVTDTAAALAKIDEQIQIIEGAEIASRVFKIENADIKEVETRLKEALSGEPEIILDERLRLIVVRSTQDNLDKAAQIIEIIDADLPLAVFPINFLKRDQVNNLIDMIREIVGDDLKKLTYNEGNRRMIVEAPPNKLKKIRQIIDAIDIPTGQVFIVCEIIEVGANDEFQFGVDWAIGDDVGKAGLSGAATDALPIKNVYGGSGDLVQLGTTGFDLFFLKPEQYLLTIKALKSRSDTRTISSPRLLVRDDGEALFNDGGSEPVATFQTSGYGYNPNDPNYAYGGYANVRDKVVGLQLELTDVHVSENGYVELTINLNDEQVLQRIDVGNNQTGVRTTRIEIDTELVLKNHHTAVMGGVLRRRKSIDRKGVPFLSEIPLLGFLGRSTGRQEDQRRLLLFVTPHIINIENPFDMNLSTDRDLLKFYQDQKIVDFREEDELMKEEKRRQELRRAGIDPDADRPAAGRPLESGGRIAIPVEEKPEDVMTVAPPTEEKKESSEEPQESLAPDESGRVLSLQKRVTESDDAWDPGVRLGEVVSDKKAIFYTSEARRLQASVGDKVGRTARLVGVDPETNRAVLENLTTRQRAELSAEGR
ncbi:hypothetical protein HS125_17835 [bacterium]|nr:hypothetical protein [bacterium]